MYNQFNDLSKKCINYVFLILNLSGNKYNSKFFKIERRVGLLLLFILYIFSSTEKLLNFKKTKQKIEKKKIPFPLLATLFAIISQYVGMFAIIYYEIYQDNINIKLFGKYLLIFFTLLATYFYHNPLVDRTQDIQFMKNLSITGGLLLI